MSDELPKLPPEQSTLPPVDENQKRTVRRYVLLGSIFAVLALGGMVATVVFLIVDRIKETNRMTRLKNDSIQIGLALQNYHSAMNHFPPAAYCKPPLEIGSALGWRVEILDYWETAAPKQFWFKPEEPWDSPFNLKEAEVNPPVYADPYQKVLGFTTYRVFVGPGTMFDPNVNDGKGISLGEVTDDRHSTILFVEAEEGVEWSRYKELPYGAGVPLPPLAVHQKGAGAIMADGSFRLIPLSTSEYVLRGLITRNGHEEIPPD